jgi:hypothetical protein
VSAQSVYRDPATGRFGPPPVGASLPAPAQLSTPAPALRETAGPRGGWMVRLDGRFHSQVTVQRQAGGPVTTTCDQARP